MNTTVNLDAEALCKIVVDALEDVKAQDIHVIDVRDKSSVTDIMVVASGTSSRQTRALANNVVVKAKEHGVLPIGTEGETEGEWVLIDLGDVVVHVMVPHVRDFYNLEKLWATEMGAESDAGDTARG
ncbi:ribosome silencing factor [Sulfuriflexus sp.]|uniref:ribosome silencing factor n=1 Tax=Sulfuriflexus sp. TaxID=2015443 RepID=UPI0028CF6A08|nr:ribosome silencing factor [Sulfuriflexus sp.]MDT8404467.1 ribosome silencing factor [Sulfuriflexus sp.]